MAGTILRLGWTDPRSDVFGAHPLLGDVMDLNDGVTFTLLDGSLELEPPAREVALTGNPRTMGERATRALYRRNRQARLQLCLGPMASASDLAASIRSLVRWLDAAPAVPLAIQWQPPSATSPVYLDVVGAAHGIPADEREWLRLQVEPIEIVFVVRPGLRGDRVRLSNLVANPGFEQASGPGVSVFNDTFDNANAYTVYSGAAPTAAANVLTLAAGSILTFGSPAWGAVNQWRVRFQMPTATVSNPQFALHWTDANNYLALSVSTTTIFLNHVIGGTVHTLGSAAVTLTQGTWYWMTLTQFPAAPGEQPDVSATLYADNAGALGAQLAAVGPVATFDAVTAISGHAAIWANITTGSTMAVGGAFSNVQTLSLFGPGGWAFSGTNGTAGVCSGAWEQSTANTYSGGAVTSYGAFRMDLAPAGAIGAYVYGYLGGAAAGSNAIAIAAGGDTLAAAVWARSSGLSATATIDLRFYEYDAGGVLIQSNSVHTATGNLAAWTQLAGTLVTQPTTAWVGLLILVSDTSGSNGGTVWLDNVQCWNETATGQTSMPYCELRFPHSPAQLLVTGLLGDLPAPAHLAWGTYLASWALGSTLTYALGRRAQASANARLAATSNGFYGTALLPTATPVLDATAYGGYYPSALVNPGWNPRAFSLAPADAPGIYHLLTRFWTAQSAGNLGNVQTRVTAEQKRNPWFGDVTGADAVGEYYGPYVAPLSASATWTVVDAGQFNVPTFPAGALADLSATYLTPRSQWSDSTAGGSQCRSDWQMLLPVDGSLLVGLLNNPSNAAFAVTGQWLWVYHDGLLVNRAAVGDTAATTYSIEGGPLSAPARGAGGPGTSTTGVININSGADPYLTLDPTISCAAAASTAIGGNGVNQLAGYVADNAGAVLPLHVELQYSPLYLYPR